ncbi:Mak10 subunit, NatC N-terminal acetyltransferase-domain-containing protein [Gilbertella persicaria]|uniref:Mak10 subunit, NatC N-terminal acetyltransferase-domain-containing protein n=1 Tax=Gilbertella persicaria TaxID=101096 RepID=UPI00221E6647|nr:Mak10 subunit, NatC N-terminal acetyltransferase-domain-containing protein [Gilbertella persicaria]KAI8072180.1 Mak10 subunit, NatC N-terminal acetyltransferase-domain-containing protein [Gilbertella persicaria]
MSAIEIMDPRMDTGMAVAEPYRAFDITQQFSAEQILSIMDKLVTREMAWISGHSLSQTVYTCIYFHHIQSLNEFSMPTLTSPVPDIIYGVLRTYILATVKCCHYIWMEMTQGNIYEEEDFTTNLFGLSFDHQHPDIVIFNDLDSSIMLLNHLLNNKHKEKSSLEALLNRIEIRKSFLLSLIYLSQQEGSHLPQAKKELETIMKLLDKVDLSLAQDVPEAFDPNISRKLTTQTPPRPVELATESESFKEYGLLIKRLRSICDVVDFTSVTSLMNYFLAFASQVPYPDAFTRSKLNTLFFHNQRIFGTLPVPTLMIRSIREMVQPPSWWLSSSKIPPAINPAEFLNAHDTLKSFLDRVAMVFVEFFKINCHNRSRQQRMLRKVVSEWEILQEEAAGVDEIFHALQKQKEETPYYFSSWAYNLKLGMMEKILFLGFELDLYGAHEYIMIYWYTQCVLSSRAFLLDRISTFVDQPSYYIHTQQLLNHVKKTLSEAILKLLLTAKHTHQFDQRPLIFDDEETRYHQRFKSFMPLISPPHPSYAVYRENIEIQGFDVARMTEIIKSDLLEAKKALEHLLSLSPEETSTDMCPDQSRLELKDILRVVVANTIGLRFINNQTSIDCLFKYHPWFAHPVQ